MTATISAAAERDVVVRPLAPGDVPAIHRIFGETLLLGRCLPFDLVAGDAYRDLCLAWYLDDGRPDVGVAVDHRGEVVGYALVCRDSRRHARRARRATARLAWRVAVSTARGRLDPRSRRFYAWRLRDTMALVRSHTTTAAAHAHLNVAAGHRTGTVALALRDHVDRRCAAAGIGVWVGEVNAPAGRRVDGLGRAGFEVVARTVNHTLTGLSGDRVERLTVVRDVPLPGG